MFLFFSAYGSPSKSWQIYSFTVVHGVKVRAFLSVRHAALAHEQTVGVVPAVLGALDTELSVGSRDLGW